MSESEIIPEAEFDDLFIYTPSFIVAESQGWFSELNESKAFGKQGYYEKLLAADTTAMLAENPEAKAKRRVGSTVGKRVLDGVKASVSGEGNALIVQMENNRINPADFRKQFIAMMRTAWRDVFLAGYRASGQPGTGKGGNQLVDLKNTAAIELLKKASAQEMKFLNKFLDDVISGAGKMGYPQRFGMYVKSLDSFYDNARIMGMPPNVAIHWVGPRDKRTCKGCEFLFRNSPYTKVTLPTVPRAGMTPCLTNCRDRLLVRFVPWHEMARLEQKGSADQYLKQLQRIKRDG